MMNSSVYSRDALRVQVEPVLAHCQDIEVVRFGACALELYEIWESPDDHVGLYPTTNPLSFHSAK